MTRKRKDFLDTDHIVSLDGVVALLNAELQWHYQHPMKEIVEEVFRSGFIKGLEQAKYLIIEYAKIMVDE